MQAHPTAHPDRKLRPIAVAALLLFVSLIAPASASAGVVQGKITDGTGDPLPGAHVRLMDRDPLNRDDFMGEAITDANGAYRIEYKSDERWDDFFGSYPEPYILVTVPQPPLPDDAVLDADDLVWRSHYMVNTDPSGMKVVNLQAKQYCKKRGFLCRGVCSGGCRGNLILGFGSCAPCDARAQGDASALSPDELQQLAAAGCGASE